MSGRTSGPSDNHSAGGQGKNGTVVLPDRPAPRGYLANPYRDAAEKGHQLFQHYLSPAANFQYSGLEHGVEIYVHPRRPEDSPTHAPVFKGKTFVANFRPLQILEAIHQLSYRLIWDLRIGSGGIMQRYGHHSLLFYIVYRGIGPIHPPRDSAGVQDVRCWDAQGQRQSRAVPSSHQIDLVYRSVDAPEVPLQEGKVRMKIYLGGYHILWREELQGCEVTFVGDVDVDMAIPKYLLSIFSRESPHSVGRLRGSLEMFGVPPFILDDEDCVVVQTMSYKHETRAVTLRQHVRKPGTYAIIIDRHRMYPNGITVTNLMGEGAHAVNCQIQDHRMLVTVNAAGVGQDFSLTLNARDASAQPTALSEWW